ncbi:putative Thioredoxin-like superfamily [Helianthus annuus]|nr:putative Thioredoxin-like superfamily [Helianthus annuus]
MKSCFIPHTHKRLICDLSIWCSKTMARVLSNMLFNGFRSMEYTTASASRSFLQHGMRFSTSVPNDPEITLKDIVEQDVKDNLVMIYMKGDPEQPRCGFSSLAVRVLSEYSKLSNHKLVLFLKIF